MCMLHAQPADKPLRQLSIKIPRQRAIQSGKPKLWAVILVTACRGWLMEIQIMPYDVMQPAQMNALAQYSSIFKLDSAEVGPQ